MTIRVSTAVWVVILCISAGIFYFLHFHYIDFKNGCSITLHPGLLELNNRNVMQALTVLKLASPEDYHDVCANIQNIHLTMSCGGWQGGCYYGKTGEVYLSTTHDEFLAYTASVLVHETCHDMQKRQGRPYSEDECYARGNVTLQKIIQTE